MPEVPNKTTASNGNLPQSPRGIPELSLKGGVSVSPLAGAWSHVSTLLQNVLHVHHPVPAVLLCVVECAVSVHQ